MKRKALIAFATTSIAATALFLPLTLVAADKAGDSLAAFRKANLAKCYTVFRPLKSARADSRSVGDRYRELSV